MQNVRTLLEHTVMGLVLAVLTSASAYLSGVTVQAAIIAGVPVFFIGFKLAIDRTSLETLAQDILDVLDKLPQNTSNLTVTAVKAATTAQPIVMARPSTAATPVQSDAVRAQNTAAAQPVLTLSAIPSQYGVQVGKAVTVTASNVAYQDFGDGEQVPNAHIGDVARKTSAGWYVVDTPNGAAYTRINPLKADSYYAQAAT